MQFIATTNPGLERVAIDEIRELVGAEATYRYRGTISFEADERAIYELNYRSRTLHRVGIALVDEPFEDLDSIYDLVHSLPLHEYVADGQTFGVRATRHGDHEFGSPDVGEVVGQAVIDAYRDATGHRLPVDLDDPEVVFRAFVRNDHFYFVLDTTGEHSLHYRHYRICEHNSPLRPTIAASMLDLAGYEPGDRLLDATCGSATIPTEAALAALGEVPGDHRDVPGPHPESYDFQRLPFLADDVPEAVRRDQAARREAAPDRADLAGTIRGRDVRERWLRCARENLSAAGVEDVVAVERGDARERAIDADVVVANLPFGIRTPHDVRDLYEGFSGRLREGEWRRAVFLTTNPDFLDLDPTEVIDVRYGRLEAAVVVIDREA